MPHSLAHLTTADLVLRVGAVHAFDGTGRVWRSLAVRDGVIVAVAAERQELDGLIGPGTAVVDDQGLVALPGFFDSHNHLLHTGIDLEAVQLGGARSIDDLVLILRAATQCAPTGAWIAPSKAWHESNLREGRLPTAAELDGAGDAHPIALRRGGHVMVANRRALALAGITRDTPDPVGGTIERDAHGEPTGLLVERPAFGAIDALLPVATARARAEGVRRACAAYNARGIVAVREPGVYAGEIRAYQDARDQGWLTVRSHVMIRLDPGAGFDGMMRELMRWDIRTGFGDDMLRLDGVKIFVDGGVEGAALVEPYASDPSYRGHLLLDTAQLSALCETALDRGWRIRCHVVGDRAVATALDAWEAVTATRGPQPAGVFVLEHAILARPEDRRRAIALGVPITVQHPLLWFLAAAMTRCWGGARAADAFPVREWLEEGATVAAGSDSNVAPFDPLLSIWGLCTRGTATAGVLGPSHAIDRRTAFELYTTAGARLTGDARRGPLAPGYAADLAAFHTDPLECPADDLPALPVALTLLGGRAVHDPDGRVGCGGSVASDNNDGLKGSP